MFSCNACGNAVEKPHRFRSIGVLCAACANFMRRMREEEARVPATAQRAA